MLNKFNRWLQDSVFKPLEDKKMPVMEHLVEFQARLTRAVIVMVGDALDLDLRALAGADFDVVANIPYHVTSPILHRLLESPPRPGRIVLMVQREVAERIAAAPGALSYLAVFCQYHARVRLARVVPPTAFEPEPAVDSAIVVLAPLLGFFGECVGAVPFFAPPVTRDQIKLLKRDNVVADGAAGLKDLGVAPKTVEAIVPAYLVCFRKYGQFAERLA